MGFIPSSCFVARYIDSTLYIIHSPSILALYIQGIQDVLLLYWIEQAFIRTVNLKLDLTWNSLNLLCMGRRIN